MLRSSIATIKNLYYYFRPFYIIFFILTRPNTASLQQKPASFIWLIQKQVSNKIINQNNIVFDIAVMVLNIISKTQMQKHLWFILMMLILLQALHKNSGIFAMNYNFILFYLSLFVPYYYRISIYDKHSSLPLGTTHSPSPKTTHWPLLHYLRSYSSPWTFRHRLRALRSK